MIRDTRAQTALRLFLHSSATSAAAIIGVIAIVFLVGIHIAILFGVIDIISNEVVHSGADCWIVTKDTDNIDFSSQMPISYIDRVVGLQDVEYARPFISTTGLVRDRTGRNELALVTGVKIPQLTGGPWVFQKGAPADLLDPFTLTIDNTTLTAKNSPDFGHLVDVQNRKFRLNAITSYIRCFRGNVSYMSEANARKLFHLNPAFCNAVMVKFKPNTPLKPTLDRIQSIVPYATVLTTQDLANKTVSFYLLASGVGGSLAMSCTLAASVGVIIIGLTLFNNIASYERDIAILRVLGARKKDILFILLYQVAFIAAVGLLIGFVLLAITLNLTFFTRIPVALPFWFAPVHAFVTIAFCLMGSFFALRHALKVDPSSVFR